MNRLCLLFLAISAITANLLLPQRLISYETCCYDESGFVTACCRAQPSAKLPLIIHSSCCDPIERTLRHGESPQIVPSQKVDSEIGFDVPPLLAPGADPPFSLQPSERALVQSTGPPLQSDVLQQHSRLNI